MPKQSTTSSRRRSTSGTTKTSSTPFTTHDQWLHQSKQRRFQNLKTMASSPSTRLSIHTVEAWEQAVKEYLQRKMALDFDRKMLKLLNRRIRTGASK